MKTLTKISTSVVALLLLPISAFAAFNNDLSIADDDLVIKPKAGVVAGQIIKLYVTARNNGDKDLIGTVKFFVDGNQVTTDQPVSVKQGSIPDEVFVNWVAIAGNHKVSAQVYPYDAEGDDSSNNYAEEDLFVDSDTDGDGVGDSVDVDDDNDGIKDPDESTQGTNPKKSDTDNDGVNDGKDVFPIDPAESIDTDKDGIGNNADTDDDNDGLPDEAEAKLGTDPLKPDTDGDGVESCNDLKDAFPLDTKECKDSDGDGVGDNFDLFPNDPKESADCDKDGIGNNADKDDDNDGHLDSEDAFPCDPAEWQDTDKDGVGNNADTDDDNDGYCDATPAIKGVCKLNPDGSTDAFPFDPTEWFDSDKDGMGDNADPNDGNQGPVAILEGEMLAIVNNQVTFDGSKSQDADGKVMSYSWDFGDGSPILEGAIAPHIYKKVGDYIVKLTVTDDKGESRVKQATVMVENSHWLEDVLMWLLLLLLILFLYIFYKTVKQGKKRKK
ncbi:MAG: PKD domain-containing protein [Candidatus Gracilibacteria bacterium]|nr:PKD domain-containing protein [Candidatus Gracilibacteria bacterium]MDD5179045.1 PKD domain-containing protein [Candidatus Gracilibacteria bacterium]